MKIDEVDLSILSILQNDARTPFTHIAEKLNVSDATIHVRIKKMEEAGLIEKYTIIVNEAEMGEFITVYILIGVEPGSINSVCTDLIELKDVYEIYEIHGQYDLIIKIRGQNLDYIREMLITKIRSIPHIISSEAYTVYKIWKKDFGVRILDSNE